MISLVEIIIIFAIISTNVISLIFAQKSSSKLIGLLISTLFVILFCTVSFGNFIIIRDLVFALIAFFITILLLFFIPKFSDKISKEKSDKPNIAIFLVLLLAFSLFIFVLINIDDFQNKTSVAIAQKEKLAQDQVFVSSHADDELVKKFYSNKKANLEQISRQENIREFRISNNKILKEKLTDNPLLYRFSEIVLLASMFVSILFIFSNKKA